MPKPDDSGVSGDDPQNEQGSTSEAQTEGWTFEDEAIIELLGAGRSYAEAGAVVGYSARTVRRRMAIPSFASAVARRREERLTEITGRMADLADVALEVLETSLYLGTFASRLRAAQYVLTMAPKFHAHAADGARFLGLESSLGLLAQDHEVGHE